MYRWWVFVHLVGVFGFLAAHGVSMGVALRLRRERDPARITALLELSSRSITPLWISLGVLLAGGVVAAFLGRLWSYGWIWAAVLTLVVVTGVMSMVARPYYRKAGVVARALTEGTEAVTPEQFDAFLDSPRPLVLAWIGAGGIVFILFLMLFKPSLGLAPGPVRAAGPGPALAARNSLFFPSRLRVPAGEAFSLAFRNDDPGVKHNVTILRGDAAAFAGDVFDGPASRTYAVPALPAGAYRFRCDVHPATMTGTLEAA